MAECFRRLCAVALGAIVAGVWTASAAAATERPGEETVLACAIEGKDREASISIAGTRATYRYGRRDKAPELTLSTPLASLDYRRKDGAGDTQDEIVTFINGDTAYRFAAGFRNGKEPDPSALRPFGMLTVSRGGKLIAQLACVPSRIERQPDGLLAAMRDIGRDRASDDVFLPNYSIHPLTPAAQALPCESDSNVDTCWSRGVSAARRGDLPGALAHYDMSCEARITTMGCYEAGKLYLHNRQLHDYARAKQRLARTCDGEDTGQGPYACKYLGWMYLTGTGVPRDLDQAFGIFAQACFLHNDANLIDPEGCHFLGRTALERRGRSLPDGARAEYLAFLAFSQGCTDDAKTVCDEARALYQQEAARGAAWIAQCDRDAGDHGAITSCARLAIASQDYDTAQGARRQLAAIFRTVSTEIDRSPDD